jgi:glyoxylase-like metal-dependent hydrolase (beta-lactamase superfamily II)
VYVVRHGPRAALIDFGDGEVLDHLSEIGVAGADWVLHTHFHRDQCGGDRKAVGARIPIAVPEHERRYFENAEDFRRARRLFHSTDVQNNVFGPVADIRVARSLADGEVFEWGPYRFRVLATPGHTPGSITLVAEIDGATTAFTGDLIHSPGKVVSLFDLQYRPGALDGVLLSLNSLRALSSERLDRLCPSHGPVMEQPRPALDELHTNLRLWYINRSAEPSDPLFVDAPPQPESLEGRGNVFLLGPNLICAQAGTTFYAVAGEGGAGLLIDYGAAGREVFAAMSAGVEGGPAMRAPAHSLPRMKELGVRTVEVVIPTRVTDAAVCGLPLLAAAGARVWAHESLADVLEHPSRYNLPGLMARPITVDRVLRDGEAFDWRGRSFTVWELPSAGRFSVGVFCELNGVRYAFTGDALARGALGLSFPRPTYRNGVTIHGRVKTLAVVSNEMPEWICPGRGIPLRLERDTLPDDVVRTENDRELWRRIIAGPTDWGLDPGWASIYPYQIAGTRGDQFRCEVRVRNGAAERIEVRARLDMPVEWRAEPDAAEFTVERGRTGSAAFDVLIPAPFVPIHRTQSIAADLWIDGRHLGRIADAIVHVGELGAGRRSG